MVQKWSTHDVQSERTALNGTRVYAQNKVSDRVFQDCILLIYHMGSFPKKRLILGYTLIWILAVDSSTWNVPWSRGSPLLEGPVMAVLRLGGGGGAGGGASSCPGRSHKSCASLLGVSQAHPQRNWGGLVTPRTGGCPAEVPLPCIARREHGWLEVTPLSCGWPSAHW